jgi:hypothetical protein
VTVTWQASAAIVGLALVGAFLPVSPATVERAYATTFYPPVQRLLTRLSNLVPFAWFDVLTVGALCVVAILAVRTVAEVRRQRRWRPVGLLLARVITAAALIYLAFLALWGLNYRRPAMSERLVMEPGVPDSAAVVALGLQAARELNALHDTVHADAWPEEPLRHAALRDAFAALQPRLSDAPPAVPGRLKQTIYGPYFRWTSVDGMINPLGLEVLVNPDLLPFERPFVAAHEWAHLAGYADEADANFVGWLTCLQADPAARYSGWIYLFWQITGEVGRDARATLSEALGSGPRRDLQAIADRIRAGQLPALRRASWQVYDHYLRANRVEEGIRSYGAVINLVLRAEFEDGWIPVRRSAVPPSR